MEKFDENNNPIFSRTESYLVTLLAVFGFGTLALAILIAVGFVYFYPLFFNVKEIVAQYPTLSILIFFLMWMALAHSVLKLIKWVKS